MNDIHSILTEREAAKYIGMSRSFLRHARIDGNRKGRTPAPKFIKIGRAVRYPRDELEKFLAQFPRQSHLCEKGMISPIPNKGGSHASSQ